MIRFADEIVSLNGALATSLSPLDLIAAIFGATATEMAIVRDVVIKGQTVKRTRPASTSSDPDTEMAIVRDVVKGQPDRQAHQTRVD